MASLIGRTSGLCVPRSSSRSSSVLKAALPSRVFVRPTGPLRKASFVPRAEGDSQIDSDQVVRDLQGKWDKVENKTQVALYSVGVVFALWLSSQLVGSVNHIPLLPRVFEAVGLGYSSWFTYRYLLFKSGRTELLEDVEALKKQITGDGEVA